MTPERIEEIQKLNAEYARQDFCYAPITPDELTQLLTDSEELSRVKAERDALQADKDRLFDLVRYVRSELHQQDLITDEEYGWLLDDDKSKHRLNTYDNLRATLTEAQAKLAAMEGEREDFRSQLLRLINASASLTSSCPEFPPTSKPHTAVAFCKSEIERAARIVEGKQPTKVDEAEAAALEKPE